MSDNQRPFPGAPDDPDRTEQLPAGASQETPAAPQDEPTRPEPLLTEPVAAVAAPSATQPVTPAPVTPAPAPAPAHATVLPTVPPVTEPRRGPRVGAVVWGLVVVVLGIGILVSIAGFRIDTGLAAILVLGAAGLALVVGSLVTSLRRRP
ncbi:hypothetical protein L1785_17035 [Antribacter sp. KLBMP9083]|uniref:Uncharacterized protein n=1 Tax=Antribacter soli TaxID=2910976 RepID=A0AA41U8G5_9MICO|nr:hypothetical protein [Antribacter soli]MCF4122686.1 hypothetical protein [Antribacter soli]